MARTPRDVTDTELALLQALWEGGPTTIQQLTEAVYGEATASKYGTVQKLLERLEAKGYVRRERRAPAHVYRACVAREELIGRSEERRGGKEGRAGRSGGQRKTGDQERVGAER